jgi:hypothetical protein
VAAIFLLVGVSDVDMVDGIFSQETKRNLPTYSRQTSNMMKLLLGYRYIWIF